MARPHQLKPRQSCRRTRVEPVPAFGAPRRRRRPSHAARSLRGQGKGALGREADAAPASGRPHLHGDVGVFYIGLGDTFDGDKVTAYPPGSVIVLPGDTWHFHWAKSGEYVTQVSAMVRGPRDRSSTTTREIRIAGTRLWKHWLSSPNLAFHPRDARPSESIAARSVACSNGLLRKAKRSSASNRRRTSLSP